MPACDILTLPLAVNLNLFFAELLVFNFGIKLTQFIQILYLIYNKIIKVEEHSIPTYVRAGAFITMTKLVQTTDDYKGDNLEIHYPNDPRAKRLVKKFNPNRISESLKGSKYTSYSVNKGESIAICLRHKDNTFMEWNTIIFVTLHEIAHILTVEEQHPPIFWKNMKFLLEQAEEIGLYVPIDYSKTPEEYCGMQISSSPYDFEKKDN